MLLPPKLHVSVLPGTLAVILLPGDAEPPRPRAGGLIYCVTVTPDEVSVVCAAADVPEGVTAERGLRALKIEGPLEFDTVGLLSSMLQPLAAANVSVFPVSTYDTDYVLVSEKDLRRAVMALKIAGHRVEPLPAGQEPLGHERG